MNFPEFLQRLQKLQEAVKIETIEASASLTTAAADQMLSDVKHIGVKDAVLTLHDVANSFGKLSNDVRTIAFLLSCAEGDCTVGGATLPFLYHTA